MELEIWGLGDEPDDMEGGGASVLNMDPELQVYSFYISKYQSRTMPLCLSKAWVTACYESIWLYFLGNILRGLWMITSYHIISVSMIMMHKCGVHLPRSGAKPLVARNKATSN